jgi:hypothetical protein
MENTTPNIDAITQTQGVNSSSNNLVSTTVASKVGTNSTAKLTSTNSTASITLTTNASKIGTNSSELTALTASTATANIRL